MKQIIAIIRMAKMNETKEALAKIGLPSFVASGKVQGRGRGLGVGPTYADMLSDAEKLEALKESNATETRLKTKRMITIIVTDDKADQAIQTLIDTNKTGNSGDGKIFVTPCAEAIQIRTGETGNKILD